MAVTHVTLTDGLKTTIKTRQHVYHADEPPQDGGTDTAVSPMEMVLGALGSCIAITVKLYAQRKGWPLERVEVAVDEERFGGKDYADYEGDAKYIYEIRKNIRFYGPLDEKQIERLYDIAGKCPVHRMIDLPTFWKELELETEAESEGTSEKQPE